MKRVVVLVFSLCICSAVLCGADKQRGVIRIPTQEAAARLPQGERRELEILFATTIEKALQDGRAIPGRYIDLDDPNIWFVREYNLWLEKRDALVKSFGVDIFRNVIDLKEMMQFEKAEASWVEYYKSVDDCYRQFKQARRSFKKLKQRLDKERDGAYLDY